MSKYQHEIDTRQEYGTISVESTSCAGAEELSTNCTLVGHGCRVYGGASNVFLYGDNLLSDTSYEVIVGDTMQGTKIPWSVKLLIRVFPRTVEWILRHVLN